MELENTWVYSPVQTNVALLVVVEKNLKRSVHPVPIDVVQVGFPLHQQLAMVPKTPVDAVAVRLLKRLQ